jgi:hypothetical protein
MVFDQVAPARQKHLAASLFSHRVQRPLDRGRVVPMAVALGEEWCFANVHAIDPPQALPMASHDHYRSQQHDPQWGDRPSARRYLVDHPHAMPDWRFVTLTPFPPAMSPGSCRAI